MTLVVDASALVALLVDGGPSGQWVSSTVARQGLAAPDLLPWEVTNVLRRLESGGAVPAGEVAQARADLGDLAVELWPHSVLSDAVWALRGSITAYDAGYVALAARLGAPLVTLDGRLGRAAASRCRVLSPS